jgi:hypothetical protein
MEFLLNMFGFFQLVAKERKSKNKVLLHEGDKVSQVNECENKKKKVQKIYHSIERFKVYKMDYSSDFFYFLLYLENILFSVHLHVKYEFLTT